MKYLLDSCILIWWLTEPKKIKEKAHQVITDGDNELYVSAATVWELGIKQKIGRINLPYNLWEVLLHERIKLLDITPMDAMGVIDLPDLHQDPFDRMLIAQAKLNNLTLITRDTAIKEYPISVLLG